MTILTMIPTVQIPLLSALLLSGCATKVIRILRVGSVDRRPRPDRAVPDAAAAADRRGHVRAGARPGHRPHRDRRADRPEGPGHLRPAGHRAAVPGRDLLTAGAAGRPAGRRLRLLRRLQPCPGQLADADPVGAALAGRADHDRPGPGPAAARGLAAATLLGLLAAELALIAGLSPELGEALVRLGYSEPCELRVVPAERTLTALRRSKQWRRHAGLITADVPADVWRELCWRYLVFPARYGDREAEIVFAVFLRQRRPQIHTALVDAATGPPLAWPAAGEPVPWRGRRGGSPASGPRRPHGGLPLSTDL